MKRILLTFLALVIVVVAGAAWAAPTVTIVGKTVTVSQIDGDFTWSYACEMYGPDGQGARYNWIMFMPGPTLGAGTAGTYVKIDNGSPSGPCIFYAFECDVEIGPTIIYYNGARLKPVIDFSECSVGHDTSAVIFQLEE